MESSRGCWVILFLLVVAGPVRAQVWKVDYAHSSLTVAAAGAASVDAWRFRRFRAWIAYDPRDIMRAKFDVRIDVASLDTGNRARDREWSGPAFLDVARFPRASFASVEFRRAPDGTVRGFGELILHGVVRPVVLDVAFAPHGDSATLDVSARLDPSDFGISSSGFHRPGTVTVRGHLLLHAARD